MNKYEPELGQALFGQPYKTYGVPDWLTSFLDTISAELERVMQNTTQKPYYSPFGNTGNKFKNDVFEVEAYSWNDEWEQPYNFKWGEYEISWYKYCGRGMSINKEMTPKTGAKMLDDCLASIRKMDVDL